MLKERKKALLINCVALAVVAIGVIGYFGYNAYRINLITNMTFEEMFAFTTRCRSSR